MKKTYLNPTIKILKFSPVQLLEGSPRGVTGEGGGNSGTGLDGGIGGDDGEDTGGPTAKRGLWDSEW
ncbi:MAG: hypothetical protein IJS06_06185 [Prevotella sp.]|nr:hypothetical protein [Prevotella sp.]MBQ7150530.1 hypothetical protein [Prevotella sp.]